MDMRGDSRNLKSGDRVTASDCPPGPGFGGREWLLETIGVDSIDNPIGGTQWLSPIIKSSKQATEHTHEWN